MKLRLHHVFILTGLDAPPADKLVSLGMQESFGRVHQGQGTANRRFEFSNGMLEFLWVHDMQEATTGPGARLRLAERAGNLKDKACPFGVILSPVDSSDCDLPFSGWSYQPDYFEPPMAFHVGGNSEQLAEPLCIYAPFFNVPVNNHEEEPPQTDFAGSVQIKLSVACNALSDQLTAASFAHGLQVSVGDEHLMELTFDDRRRGMHRDFRPELPLIIRW